MARAPTSSRSVRPSGARAQGHVPAVQAGGREGDRLHALSELPGQIDNPFEDPYIETHPFDCVSSCDGWCYCRGPRRPGAAQRERVELVESDFADAGALCARAGCDDDGDDGGDSGAETIDCVYSLPSERADERQAAVAAVADTAETEARARLPVLCDRMGLRAPSSGGTARVTCAPRRGRERRVAPAAAARGAPLAARRARFLFANVTTRRRA